MLMLCLCPSLLTINSEELKKKNQAEKSPNPLHTLSYRPITSRPDDVFPFWSLRKAKQKITQTKTRGEKKTKRGGKKGKKAREKGKKKANTQNKATKTHQAWKMVWTIN